MEIKTFKYGNKERKVLVVSETADKIFGFEVNSNDEELINKIKEVLDYKCFIKNKIETNQVKREETEIKHKCKMC